jgi:hypothetical protein
MSLIPSTQSESPAVLWRQSTMALVFAVALAGAAVLVGWGPVHLVPHMHVFADQATVRGVPYGSLVLSHLPLIPIGFWGMWRVSRLPKGEPLRWIWGCFFCCQMMATTGGMVYHWAPSDVTFIWDQVPKSAASTLFALAFVAERIDRRFGSPVAVLSGLILPLLGGMWWLYSLQVWGEGDLRLLIWLELSPMTLVATGAWTLHGHLLTRADWLRSQISFAVAQTVDWSDKAIYEGTGHFISGHAVRHLALAACVGWVAYRLGAPGRQLQAELDAARKHEAALKMASMAASMAAASTASGRRGHQAKDTSLPDRRLAS